MIMRSPVAGRMKPSSFVSKLTLILVILGTINGSCPNLIFKAYTDA